MIKTKIIDSKLLMIPTDGAKVFIKNKKENKFLLLLRDDDSNIPYPNHWCLFGGGIEPGEEPLAALQRELQEETNIELYDIQQIDRIAVPLTIKDQTRHVTGYIFIAYTDAQPHEIRVYEGQKAKYFTLNEIKQLKNRAPGALSSIENYESLLK